MEYSPPPLFKQGASARAKVAIFSLLAIALLIGDARLQALPMVRKAVGTALYPLQMAALLPRDAAHAVSGYFTSVRALEKENLKLKNQQVANAQVLQQSHQLAAENAHLRRLLGASERLAVKSVMTEILYDARDAFTRKIVLDRGSRDGVEPGQPVIDDTGVVGQVTRVFPFTAEATLLTDKDQAIPVQVARSGLRSVAYGRGQSGVLELRFMATNADIRKGDLLVTSGIDGVYPAGLAVGQVVQVETKSTDAFARILCQPAAGIDRNRQLLILLTDTSPPSHAPAEDPKDGKPAKGQPAPQKEGPRETKEAAREAPAGVAPIAAPAAPQDKPTAVPIKAEKPVKPTPKPAAPVPAPQPAAAPMPAPKPPTVAAKPQGNAAPSPGVTP